MYMPLEEYDSMVYRNDHYLKINLKKKTQLR